MNKSVISKEDQVKISELFEKMDDSPGKDSDKLAKDWLKTHDKGFHGFVDNKWLPKSEAAEVCQVSCFSENIASVSIASDETIIYASEKSKQQVKCWSVLKPFQRSNYLKRIAETIEKNAELFAQVEALSSGKHLYRTKTKDVPNLIESFFFYSATARNAKYFKEGKANGVVCVIAEEYNNPMLLLSWRVASILATGNVVLLLVDVNTCVSAFLLAELCSFAGLPPGVLNVLPVDQNIVDFLPNGCKVVFTGERSRSNKLIEVTAKQNAICEVLVGQRPVAIVYENADLHSAANGVFEMLYFNDTRSKNSGCLVYVQASIKKKFYSLLEEKISKVTVGKNFTKTDISCIVTSSQSEKLSLYMQEAAKQQFNIHEGLQIKDATYSQFRPTLIYDVPTTSKLLHEIVEGPLIITTPFRTVKESIAMFNHNKLASDVSVWTEKLPLALEVVQKLRTRTIWINTQNVFDASVPYGGLGLSGNSIEGGKEAFYAHLNSFDMPENCPLLEEEEEAKVVVTLKNEPDIKFSCELHIGGSYKKPSSGKYRVVKTFENRTPYAYVGEGSAVDILAAVSSAVAAQPKWQNLGKFKRLQILQKAADALISEKNKLVSILSALTGKDPKEEVDESIARLIFWANHMNYCDGQFIETQSSGKVLQERNPFGVIGIQVPNFNPLLSFVSTVIPAIAYGNAVVVVESDRYPIPSLKLCEILQASGVLGGTVNVITGCNSSLTCDLALNRDIDALWYSNACASEFICKSCSTHPKRVMNFNGVWKHFHKDFQSTLLSECTFLKNIYMPKGDVFAN